MDAKNFEDQAPRDSWLFRGQSKSVVSVVVRVLDTNSKNTVLSVLWTLPEPENGQNEGSALVQTSGKLLQLSYSVKSCSSTSQAL